MKRYLSNFTVVLTLLLLVGCGFHLRAAADLSPALKTMYLEGVNVQRDLGLTLKRHLVSNGVTLVEQVTEGGSVLTVLENKYERRVLSVGSDAKVREYQLQGLLTFKVTDAAGNVLAEEQTIEAIRDYQFNQDEVLGKAEEEQLLREQMEKQIAQSVIRRLSVIK